MQAVSKQRFVGRFSLSAEWPLQRCNSSFCPNSCFSQKHAIVNPRTTAFLKNERLSTPERAFFSKTCDCQPPNDCFSQKHAIVNPRTTVFLKNMRLSPPERLFFSKTSDCQPPNDCFFSKTCDCQPPNGSPQRCNSSY